VIHNSKSGRCHSLGGSTVEGDGFRREMASGRIIRDELIAKSLFGGVSPSLVPCIRSMSDSREVKRVSRAVCPGPGR